MSQHWCVLPRLRLHGLHLLLVLLQLLLPLLPHFLQAFFRSTAR